MVIRMRHTRAHTRNRRSHHALKETTLVACAHCKAITRPHHMCLACGYYKGRQVLDLSSLKTARDARMKAKRDRIRTESGTATPATPAPDTQTTAEVKEEVKEKVARKTTRTRKTEGSSAAKTKEEN